MPPSARRWQRLILIVITALTALGMVSLGFF